MVPPTAASDEYVIDDDLVQALGFQPATDELFDARMGEGGSGADTVIDLAAGEAVSQAVVAEAAPVSVPLAPPLIGGGQPADQVVVPRRLAPDDAAVIDFRVESARGRPRLKARKVRRVVRHIDPWSVLRFSVIFHLVLFGAILIASVLVWNAAELAGVVENIESLIAELASLEEFVIDESALFRVALVSAAMFTLASSVMLVLLSVIFNLISDLTGGIRFTVIEEERVRTVRRVQAKTERSSAPAS